MLRRRRLLGRLWSLLLVRLLLPWGLLLLLGLLLLGGRLLLGLLLLGLLLLGGLLLRKAPGREVLREGGGRYQHAFAGVDALVECLLRSGGGVGFCKPARHR